MKIGHIFLSAQALANAARMCIRHTILAWPPLQSLAVKKKLYFVQILGGEKLLKFGEKRAVKNF